MNRFESKKLKDSGVVEKLREFSEIAIDEYEKNEAAAEGDDDDETPSPIVVDTLFDAGGGITISTKERESACDGGDARYINSILLSPSGRYWHLLLRIIIDDEEGEGAATAGN